MSDRLRIERVLTQADFTAFAALSGDDNPIHVSPRFSAATKFGRTVAHGVLLISILSELVLRLTPRGRISGQAIRFPAPTFADEPLAFEVEADPDNPGRFPCRVVRLADGVVTCDGWLESA